MTSLAVGYEGPSSSSWVEEGLTIPLRPALRSTASPQTVLRGTVNPSSRQHVGGRQRTAARGVEGLSRKVIPTTPPEPPKARAGGVRLHRTRLRRGIDGPPEDSPPPKAVERSAGRRRTIDSSPLPHVRKGVATPVQGLPSVERSAGRRRTVDSSPFHKQ